MVPTRPTEGIELLGTMYSARLRVLHDRVVALYGKEIRVEAIRGHADNTIQTKLAQILLRLRPGSSEDNVAHELLHAVLEAEGFPRVFSIGVLPLSRALGNLLRGDLDHLIINRRLGELGYDPHRGFLRTADSYKDLLARPPTAEGTPTQRAIVRIGLLHELLKFRYYIAEPGAESAILARYPEVTSYWRDLGAAVDALPSKATPFHLWAVAVAMNRVYDRVCLDGRADVRFSDLLGLDPAVLAPESLDRDASLVFEETLQEVPEGTLRRTFLRGERVLVGVQLLQGRVTNRDTSISGVSASDLMKDRSIVVLRAP